MPNKYQHPPNSPARSAKSECLFVPPPPRAVESVSSGSVSAYSVIPVTNTALPHPSRQQQRSSNANSNIMPPNHTPQSTQHEPAAAMTDRRVRRGSSGNSAGNGNGGRQRNMHRQQPPPPPPPRGRRDSNKSSPMQHQQNLQQGRGRSRSAGKNEESQRNPTQRNPSSRSRGRSSSTGKNIKNASSRSNSQKRSNSRAARADSTNNRRGQDDVDDNETMISMTHTEATKKIDNTTEMEKYKQLYEAMLKAAKKDDASWATESSNLSMKASFSAGNKGAAPTTLEDIHTMIGEVNAEREENRRGRSRGRRQPTVSSTEGEHFYANKNAKSKEDSSCEVQDTGPSLKRFIPRRDRSSSTAGDKSTSQNRDRSSSTARSSPEGVLVPVSAKEEGSRGRSRGRRRPTVSSANNNAKSKDGSSHEAHDTTGRSLNRFVRRREHSSSTTEDIGTSRNRDRSSSTARSSREGALVPVTDRQTNSSRSRSRGSPHSSRSRQLSLSKAPSDDEVSVDSAESVRYGRAKERKENANTVAKKASSSKRRDPEETVPITQRASSRTRNDRSRSNSTSRGRRLHKQQSSTRTSSQSRSISRDSSLQSIPRVAVSDDELSADGHKESTVTTSPGAQKQQQSKRRIFRKIKKFAGRVSDTISRVGGGVHKFKVGERARYRLMRVPKKKAALVSFDHETGTIEVEIVNVHIDAVLDLPYYTIKLPCGSKKQTNWDKLIPLYEYNNNKSLHLRASNDKIDIKPRRRSRSRSGSTSRHKLQQRERSTSSSSRHSRRSSLSQGGDVDDDKSRLSCSSSGKNVRRPSSSNRVGNTSLPNIFARKASGRPRSCSPHEYKRDQYSSGGSVQHDRSRSGSNRKLSSSSGSKSREEDNVSHDSRPLNPATTPRHLSSRPNRELRHCSYSKGRKDDQPQYPLPLLKNSLEVSSVEKRSSNRELMRASCEF